MIAATPAFAEFAQQEPTAFASMHPNASVVSASANVPFGRSLASAAHARYVKAALPSKRAAGRHGY